MSKKHFIALADVIRRNNQGLHPQYTHIEFSPAQIRVLADFCQSTNPHFNRERWLAYIAGECGPNGGRK